MKLTINREALIAGMKHITRVVERRNTIPILSNILLSAAPGKLMLRATDLDLEASTEFAADVVKAGTTTVHANTFDTLVKKFPAGADVHLEMDDRQISIRCGRSRSKLHTLPADDFPDFAAGEFTHSFSVAAQHMAELLERVTFAISTEETRYYLNGVYFHCVEHGGMQLRGVATDGHRLAQHQFAAPEGATDMPGIIIPRKTVGELSKLLADQGKDGILLEVSPTKIRVSAGRTVIVSKLIDGTFPEYQRVVPSGNNLVAIVDRGELSEATDRVSTVASEKGRAVKLQFKEGSLDLSVKNPDTGDATEVMPVKFDGEIEIGVNGRYLNDILSVIADEKIRVAMADPGSPILFQNETATGGTLFVLMPMRV